MAKLIVFNLISLDGYFEGLQHDISWHRVDEEFNEFAIKQLDELGMLFFGRVTYELMASYWPTEEGKRDDAIISTRMNAIKKIVFSKTLTNAGWQNTAIVRDDIENNVHELKRNSDKDIAIFGSGQLTSSFLEKRLIDELRIMINPVILGNGTELFKDIHTPLHLMLKNSQTFTSGNILLRYDIT